MPRSPSKLSAASSATRARRPATAARAQDLVLHVALRDLAPPIWRRILVPDRLTLHQLHRVLQLAFGWLDYHLYAFTPGGEGEPRRRARAGEPHLRYAIPDPDWDDTELDETRDSRQVTLRELALARGARLTYVYDFGDDWTHDIRVERVAASPNPEAAVPMLLDGARAGPPEDVGGVPGYERLLAVLAHPDDPEHEEMARWAGMWGGVAYDPERFDPWLLNRTLMLTGAWGTL